MGKKKTIAGLAGIATLGAAAVLGVSATATSASPDLPAPGLSAATSVRLLKHDMRFTPVVSLDGLAVSEEEAIKAAQGHAQSLVDGPQPDEAAYGLYTNPRSTPANPDGTFEKSTFADREVWLLVYHDAKIPLLGAQPGVDYGAAKPPSTFKANLLVVVDAKTGRVLGGGSL